MSDVARQGTLVIADISGYTAYLTGVELEHSHDILADLLGIVTEGLCPPLRLAKLEGDAVFCVATDDRALADGRLAERLEQTYLAFARRRRTVALSSSCTCDACRRTPDLDLKFCAHHGTFVEHEVAGSPELVGPDVILVHRLLKNSIGEKRALRGYALVTDACARAVGIAGLSPHTELYDDVGEVGCGLIDLQARWAAVEETNRTTVTRDHSDLLFEEDVDAAPAVVWEAMTDPAHGMRWRMDVTRIEEENPRGGRGAGTVTHCVHGRTTIEQEIVDWLPPHHYTYRERNPAGLCMWTFTLAPLDGGTRTHVEWRFALAGGRRQALLWKVMRGRVAKLLQRNFDALMAHVRGETAPA